MMQMDESEINEDQLALVLNECLSAILSENASLNDCLARYPYHAEQLKLLLVAASKINRHKTLEPTQAFRNQARHELMKYISSHEYKSVPVYRFALILASLVIGFLTTGTALAQGALPGDRLYEWKLASERAWRWTATDHVSVDIKLAERRSREVLAVSGDPERSLRAHQEYQNAEMVLISEIVPENKARITSVIQTQRESLEKSGITLTPVDEITPLQPEPVETSAGPSELRIPSQIPSSIPIVTVVATPDLMPTAMPAVPALTEPAVLPPVVSTPNK